MCAWFKKFADRLLGTAPEARASMGEPSTLVAAGEPTARRRRVTVGLDFGTSSSKCCFLEEGPGKRFTALAFQGNAGTRLLYNTILVHTEDTLEFGPDLTPTREQICVRSFKMCLLCQARNEGGGGSLSCPRCSRQRPGHFLLGQRWLSAEDISTLYLSVVLGEALLAIQNGLGVGASSLRVNVNAAAPLDQLQEFGSVGEYFDRCFFYALRLAESGSPRRRWQVDEALRRLAEVRREALPDTSLSPTRVFPETHAAITAYTLLPQSEKGLYAIVDIGAGTTDVSFFWLQKDEAKTAAWYYAAGTESVGMDDVDRALAPVFDDVADVRAAREAMSRDALARQAKRIAPIEKRAYLHYARIYGVATNVDQRDWAWCDRGVCQFRLFLVGGGSLCGPMVSKLRRVPPKGTTWVAKPERLTVPTKMAVQLPAGDKTTIKELKLSSDGALMLLALGLSHRRPDIPEYGRDEDGIAKVESETGWTVEEMYGHF
jgi:hypothetical protein